MTDPYSTPGLIAAKTNCSHTFYCEVKKQGQCWHYGTTNPLPYLCSTAKLYDLVKKAK